MQLGMIGLGRMGANMVRRLVKGGHQCFVFDMSPKAVNELVQEKAEGSSSLHDLVTKIEKPRAIWFGPRRGRGPNHRRAGTIS
jgi:6-phosphogluconate dehydrogenase